jgi:pentatricopeptide repeat protein
MRLEQNESFECNLRGSANIMISKGTILALLLFCWCLAEGSAWTLPLFAEPRSSMEGSSVANFRSLVQMHASPSKTGDNSITRNNPFRITRKRLDQKLLEVEQQDRLGKKLSQAYCDSILGLCVASDEWDSVLEVLDVMKRQGLKQERSSYRACLHTCFDAGNGASATEILSAMDKAGVEAEPNDIGLTVAAMCRNNLSERGWWRKALNLLKHHSKGGSTAVKSLDNVIPVQAYDAVLECMVEEKQWKEAVILLRLMEKGSSKSTNNDAANGFHPSPAVSTYRAVIECCGATYQAEQAVQVLYSMKDRGVKVRNSTMIVLEKEILRFVIKPNLFTIPLTITCHTDSRPHIPAS